MLPPLPHVVAALAGALLDRALGEPKRWHPLVGFGRLADAAERGLRRGAPGEKSDNRRRGAAAWALVVLPCVALAWLLSSFNLIGWIVDALLLWLALGGRSLAEHAGAVATPLGMGDLPTARERVGLMVSRDTTQLDAEGVAKATVESVLENGNDAVFAALFWFFLLGGPGVVLYRLANTLDAMWGYKDERRIHFGWAAARLDDGLNYIPARLTALTYAMFGHIGPALTCWRTQASAWSSPNAGPVIAAGAGALGVQLGGAAMYHGQMEQRPALGSGSAPTAADIPRALALVQRGQWLWLGVFVVVRLLAHG
jgi:adenosylcobinamide-phosphate synthase